MAISTLWSARSGRVHALGVMPRATKRKVGGGRVQGWWILPGVFLGLMIWVGFFRLIGVL
ncbi:hypothetical protein [Chachezhania antarctica]|uniref:hypothetical protein n=1 Tax=Chachezhania antarctica TaxID=2340860 RepID=UPI0013CE6F85|nr:hypothetical protein [Chachezhania antarctica]